MANSCEQRHLVNLNGQSSVYFLCTNDRLYLCYNQPPTTNAIPKFCLVHLFDQAIGQVANTWTRKMSETSDTQNFSRETEILSIRRFSDVREPVYMTSESHVDSFNNYNTTFLWLKSPSSFVIVATARLISSEAISSPSIMYHVTIWDL